MKETAPLLTKMFNDLNTHPRRRRVCHYVPGLKMTALCGAYNPPEYSDDIKSASINCPRCLARIKGVK